MLDREIKRVAIVGAGNQGPKIAYRCGLAGFEVTLNDISPESLEKGNNQFLEFCNKKQRPFPVMGGRENLVVASTDLAVCVAEADLIIEAVPENIELKRRVWADIDKIAKEEALICTNSSSQPCSRLANVLRHPDRAFNVNFSDPVHDDFVEVMKSNVTSDETLIAAVTDYQSR